jgi:hypothetical protein
MIAAIALGPLSAVIWSIAAGSVIDPLYIGMAVSLLIIAAGTKRSIN